MDLLLYILLAKDPADLLRLLQATYEATKGEDQGPVLTMAMGKAGTLSRVMGEIFGSCLTFCSLKAASAPGQKASSNSPPYFHFSDYEE